MDGILYDSLPNYKLSWSKAFLEYDFALPEIEVYMHEGRSSKDAVKKIFSKYHGRMPLVSEIDKIVSVKNMVYESLGDPPVMEGAHILLETIRSNGLPIFVVTGSSQPRIKNKILRDFPEVLRNL